MALPRARSSGFARPASKAVAIAFAAGIAAGGGWLGLRDSSLVAVRQIQVTGVTGGQAHQVREALVNAARDMTTLHVREDELRTAVAPYPVVEGVSTSTDFPHGLRIIVRERQPVAALVVDGRRTAVAADGTILRDTPATGVPSIPLRSPPGGDRLADPRGVPAVDLLAAAPPAMLARATKVAVTSHGLTVTLRDGPKLYFGSGTRLVAKWAAAARVLADPSSIGATYLDVRVPERPAAGGLEDPSAAANPGTTTDQLSTGG